MTKSEINNLINAVKSDDLVTFSKLIKNNENICFGRFPVLSLCYLFKAKKIIKNYKLKLVKVKYYDVVEEPYEIYALFRSIAGRNLRLYLADKSVVSPLEMLACMGRDGEVKRLFKEYNRLNIMTDKITKNLSKIYVIAHQNTKITKDKISITPKKLTRIEKFYYRLGVACSLSFVLIMCGLLFVINSTLGFGTSLNPYKIYNTTQLINAMNATGHYILCEDITLENNLDIDFKGNLDGNNHTIYVSTLPEKSLLTTNSGTIKNLNISYNEFTSTISDALSLLTNENNGTLDNISISVDKLTLTCNKNSSRDIYVSAYATKNSGTINNCSLSLTADIIANGDGECFVSGFVGTNTGTISGCNFASGSLTTREADVAGISAYNEQSGTIDKCKNLINISQTSEVDGWSPNVSGIALTNYGAINNCINNGELTATSTNATENAQGNIILGGISSNNFGTHSYCINNGKLNAVAKNLVVYCGGISAYSSYYVKDEKYVYPLIANCGSTGEINISTEHDNAVAFGGGLCGFLYGEANNCYSLSTFTNSYNEDKYYFGSAFGNAYKQYTLISSYVDISLSNNYVMSSDSTPYHIGSLINSGQLVSAGVNIKSGITVATENEIKQSGVYFNE